MLPPIAKGDWTVAIIRLLVIFSFEVLKWITKETVFLVLDLILSEGIACLVRYIRDFINIWLAICAYLSSTTSSCLVTVTSF